MSNKHDPAPDFEALLAEAAALDDGTYLHDAAIVAVLYSAPPEMMVCSLLARIAEARSARSAGQEGDGEWPETFPCPDCGTVTAVDDDYRKIVCPSCGGMILKHEAIRIARAEAGDPEDAARSAGQEGGDE